MENTAHHEPGKLSYQLLKQITNDFDKERILGSGGFGTVYKGVHESRGEIAVKVLHNILGLDDKEFHKEFDNLRGLKHPNIVELLGFCNESEEELVMFEGNQVAAQRLHMALCFEYVHNGSLNKHISDETTGLTWHTRYNIIKGICNGLKYLGEGLEYPIMHLDLKPDNILLDKCMSPKIADFGLSRLFGEENTRKTLSSAGTIGYCPPEYIKHQIISREFDIFSLGVIIVKIMTGHGGYNSTVEMTTQKAVTLVHDSWRKRLRETLSRTSLELYCNQVKRCIEMALDCLKSNRQERPAIHDIVSILNETETMIGDRGMQNKQVTSLVTCTYDSSIYHKPAPYTTGVGRKSKTLFASAQCVTDHTNHQNSIDRSNFHEVEPRVMSLYLLKGLTSDFSKARLLGWGGYGRVFKGVYGDGKVIAVKKLHPVHGIDDVQLQNEIKILSRVHHQNIVQFVGYCREKEESLVEYNGKHVVSLEIHQALCFEYFRRGSLEEYISEDMSAGLDWQTRYRIITGICEGLRYLHEGMERPLLHMNLKPSKILMDGQKMIPKIGGFGLARIVGTDKTLHTSHLNGTHGYMPPEYIKRSIISKGHDIFSLGVIILQLMTGKNTYLELFDMPPEKFVVMAHEKWREKLQKTVHGSLVEGYCQQVKKCLNIGVKCREENRHKRPTIGDIIHMLKERDTAKLLEVRPLELCFLKALSSSSLEVSVRRKKAAMTSSSSCLLQLENKGNDRVAFMLVANNPKRYKPKEPLCGVVPPRCAYTLTLTMPKQPPASDSCDFFTLSSVMVGVHDLDKHSVVVEYDRFFKKAKDTTGDRDKEVQEVILKAIFDTPQGMSSSQDYDYASGGDPSGLELQHNVHLAKFIAREKWLIAGDRSGCIHVYNYEEYEDLVSFDAHDSCITTLAVHSTDPFVLSSSDDDADHLIKLWDWDKDWECTREFGGHNCTVTQVTFNPKDSDRFASVSLDGTVKIWNIYSDDPNIITLELNGGVDGYVPGGLLCVDYFTRVNQHHLIVGCKDKTAQIWKLDTNECVDGLEGHADCITVVNLHPELPLLLTGSLDGTVRIWNSTTYKLENIIGFNLGAVHDFGCIKDSKRIVVGCQQGIAKMEIYFPFPDYSQAIPLYSFFTSQYIYDRGYIRHQKNDRKRRIRLRQAKESAAKLRRYRRFAIAEASRDLADAINCCSLVDKPDTLPCKRDREAPPDSLLVSSHVEKQHASTCAMGCCDVVGTVVGPCGVDPAETTLTTSVRIISHNAPRFPPHALSLSLISTAPSSPAPGRSPPSDLFFLHWCTAWRPSSEERPHPVPPISLYLDTFPSRKSAVASSSANAARAEVMSAVIDRLARHTGGVGRENLRADGGGGPRVRRGANGGAAVGGHRDAFYSSAVIQFSGSGGSKDDRDLHAGAALYAPAASLGHVDALGELGYCLQDSYGVRYSLLDGRRLLIQDNASEVEAASASLFKAFRGATGACSATSGAAAATGDAHAANRFLSEWFVSRPLGAESGLGPTTMEEDSGYGGALRLCSTRFAGGRRRGGMSSGGAPCAAW
ncbi:hypothetical protein ACQ4PT_020252 [Festuca glaucescens]